MTGHFGHHNDDEESHAGPPLTERTLVPLAVGILLVATICSGYPALAFGLQGRWVAALGILVFSIGCLLLAIFLVVRSSGP